MQAQVRFNDYLAFCQQYRVWRWVVHDGYYEVWYVEREPEQEKELEILFDESGKPML